MKNYSFGLENIYKLEKVDPSTIRVFQSNPQEKKESSPLVALLPHDELLGGFPILSLWDKMERLLLPPPLLYHLRKEGWETLEELLEAEEIGHAKIKVLPRPLQDVLSKALKPYRDLRKKGKVNKLDLKAFLRGLGREIDHLSYLTYLETFNLLNFCGATSYEKVQVERLAERERNERVKTAEKLLKEKEIGHVIQQILDGLLAGWIEKRGGITTEKEIIERVEQESLEPGGGEGVVRLMDKLFHPWMDAGEGIFTFCSSTKEGLARLSSALSSLFYREGIAYTFSQLKTLLQRELLSSGELVDVSLLHRYLLLSSSYRFHRPTEIVRSVRVPK